MYSFKTCQRRVFTGLTIGILSFVAACKTPHENLTKNSPADDLGEDNGKQSIERESPPLAGSPNDVTEAHIELASKTATELVLGTKELYEQPFMVTAEALHIRSGPGEKFNRVGLAKKGTLLKVKKIENRWAKIAENQWVGLRHIRLVSP